MKHAYRQVQLDNENKFSIDAKEYSRYIQTTWKLSAQISLQLPKIVTQVRPFTEKEAQELAGIIKKRNVFARHSWENSFYVSRAKELGNRTVIEVFRQGNPDDIITESQRVTDIIEKIVLLSSTLAIKRKQFQDLLGIKPHLGDEFNITIEKNYRYIRSKSEPVPEVKGISINERFRRRFSRCGFQELAYFCLSSNRLANRVASAINWLIESRQEPSLLAALVKSSIAFESLLIFDQSEPLAKSLSERTAFILSSEANVREQVNRIVKKIYNERSRVVHGSKTSVSSQLVEIADRLAILLCLIMANNSQKWKTMEGLRKWCEAKKWGKRTLDMHIPFPNIYLKNAIKLFDSCCMDN